MKIVFFGTPDYVTPVVKLIRSSVVAVVTQSPKAQGREKKITYSPVDRWAHKKKIPIFYRSQDLTRKKVVADMGVLAAYGEIIPETVIKHFKYGILNLHPSLLPQFRGASPIQAAIATGLKQTGVTIIRLDSKMDHGPIVSQFKEDILPGDTTGSLRERLFERGARVLVELLEPYLKGKITPREQDHAQATFTTLVQKGHGFIPPEFLSGVLKGVPLKKKWEIPFVKNYSLVPTPYTLSCFIRAMDPWPISWTLVQLNSKSEARNTKRLKILKAHLDGEKLVLDEVQLEGKNPVTWKQFRAGYPKVTF